MKKKSSSKFIPSRPRKKFNLPVIPKRVVGIHAQGEYLLDNFNPENLKLYEELHNLLKDFIQKEIFFCITRQFFNLVVEVYF